MNLIRLDSTESTNLYAKQNLSELADKSVISAERQTAGRGRFDRVWIDLGHENLFVSIILKPSNKFETVYTNITQYLSLVLCNVFEEYGLNPQIKWPNDVLINGKKIAGILSETVMQGTNFKGLVLGLGVNLNSSAENLKNIKDKEAAALNLEIGNKIDKEIFLENLLNKFFERYEEFLSKGFPYIKDEYIKRTNFLGKSLCVRVFNDTKSGTAKYLTGNGELVLENSGNEITLTIGDIL